MELSVRRRFLIVDDKQEQSGKPAEPPLRKLAVVAVVANPFADRYVEDLSAMIEASVPLAESMADRAVSAMQNYGVQSYGKAGIVGLRGEQEHANALLTTAFADPFRKAVGGGEAWISSMTKIAAPGAPIDIPLNHKDEVYVRSHYDGMTLMLPETPMPDEIAVIFCLASGGRLNARVGGKRHEDVVAASQP
jgi:hypothetical protein